MRVFVFAFCALMMLIAADASRHLKGNTITVGSTKIPRAGKPLTVLSSSDQQFVDKFVEAGTFILPGNKNFRDSTAVNSASLMPSPAQKKLGKLAVFMPGYGNYGPSLAFAIRLAAHAEKVVLAFQYSAGPLGKSLRVLDSLDGVSVPAAYKGRILAIGDPSHRAFLSQDQAADLLITYYGIMHKGQALLGFDPLTSGSTLFGHSQGSFAAAFTRDRMNKAGLNAAIGKLITMGGGFGSMGGGAKILFEMLGLIASKVSNNADIKEYLNFTEQLSKGKLDVKKYWPLIDLGVGSSIGKISLLKPIEPTVRVGMRLSASGISFLDIVSKVPELKTLNPLKIIAVLGEMLSKAGSAISQGSDTDGILPTTVTLAPPGKSLKLSGQIDHAYMIENPSVVDEIVTKL